MKDPIVVLLTETRMLSWFEIFTVSHATNHIFILSVSGVILYINQRGFVDKTRIVSEVELVYFFVRMTVQEGRNHRQENA
jgi:hypothetical protein